MLLVHCIRDTPPTPKNSSNNIGQKVFRFFYKHEKKNKEIYYKNWFFFRLIKQIYFIFMIFPHDNQYLAKEYFETLPHSDLSVRYYNGEKYSPPTNLVGIAYNTIKMLSKVE